jgi:hypothetical protein
LLSVPLQIPKQTIISLNTKTLFFPNASPTQICFSLNLLGTSCLLNFIPFNSPYRILP